MHRCFPVNFVKFLSSTFLHTTSERLLLSQIFLLKVMKSFSITFTNFKDYINQTEQPLAANLRHKLMNG